MGLFDLRHGGALAPPNPNYSIRVDDTGTINPQTGLGYICSPDVTNPAALRG